MGPDLDRPPQRRLLGRAFLLFSWTTGIDHVRRPDRAGQAHGVSGARRSSSARSIWILDAAWGWSAGGWLDDRVRVPRQRSPRRVVHGVAGAFTLGVLLPARAEDREIRRDGPGPDVQTPQPAPHAARADADLHRASTRFYAACLVITLDVVPGVGSTSTCRRPPSGRSCSRSRSASPAGFTGGYFASKGDPFWTLSGGLAGVISVSAGADVYAPSHGLPDLDVRRRPGRLRRRRDREAVEGGRCRRGGGGARRVRILRDHRRGIVRDRVPDGDQQRRPPASAGR